MVFGLFKKKDPVCGMKEEKGEGLTDDGWWFCSKDCQQEFKKKAKRAKNGCCG